MDKISELDNEDFDETQIDFNNNLQNPSLAFASNYKAPQQEDDEIVDLVLEDDLQQKSKITTPSEYEIQLEALSQQIELLKSENEQLKNYASDNVSDMQDTLAQKDRRIRHLNTSVTLLKNFLFFFKSKAIKGLRVANEDVKKEIEIFREKYIKELEDNKDKILEQISKSTTAIPSEALQNTLKHTQQEFEKFREESRDKIEKINLQHQNQLELLNKQFEQEKANLLKEKDQHILSLEAKFKQDSQTSLNNLSENETKYENIINDLKSQNLIEKQNLEAANEKISLLNTNIGRYQSSDEMNKQALVSKDTEIQDLKSQVNELINSVKTIKDHSDDETTLKISSLQNELNEYKSKLDLQSKEHSNNITELKTQHQSEIQQLMNSHNSNNENMNVQIESLNKLLKEKDSVFDTMKENHLTIDNDKQSMIDNLQQQILKLKEDHEHKEAEIVQYQAEQQKLVERIREEMQSVLSLKSAFSDEAKIASKEELNENIKIINEFFSNPYDKTLKKVFKLKRVRKDDSSVDSSDLMKKNHHDEIEEHETSLQQEVIEKVKERHVNDGRVEDMAKPGFRAIPPRPRGAPAPRGRGGPIRRGRGAPMVPPRHNTRVGMQATQSTGSSGPKQGKQITVMDPTKNIKRVGEDSPVNSLTGGITTPPRKRSFGRKESPRNIQTNPFSITNLKEESKQKEEFDPKANEEEEEEYEEEEEESEDENEEEQVVKGSNAEKPVFKPAPPMNIRQPPVSPANQRPASNKNPPPMMRQSKPVPPPVIGRSSVKKSNESDRKRDLPPMKTRNDEKPPQKVSRSPFMTSSKPSNDDRSQTPQPKKSENNIKLAPEDRKSRFSREAEDPPITHAVVRDKSIGERLRSTLLPGFLGGGSSQSNLAVAKVDAKTEENKEVKNTAEKPPKPKEQNKSQSQENNKTQDNSQPQSSAFGLFDRLLDLLGRRKTKAKQAFMGKSGAGLKWDEKKKRYIIPGEEDASDSDDLPPPPKIIKKKNEEEKSSAKSKPTNRLANRYASAFGSEQMSSEPVNIPTPDISSFKPPSFDVDPFDQTPSFDTSKPEISESPKNNDIHDQRQTNENVLEDVRRDFTEVIQNANEESVQRSKDFDDLMKTAKSEDEEVEYDQLLGTQNMQAETMPFNNQQQDDFEDSAELNKNYEKAYNQLIAYKNENKQLKLAIARNQTTAELNIDYFVQLCEDIKYRGLEEIETYKNEIKILKGEEEKFIKTQAQQICLIDKLEYENKKLKERENQPKFQKPYPTPSAARDALRGGLDELRNLQGILQRVHADQLKIRQKDKEITKIIEELLNHIDENSEQGHILRRNLDGEFDINNILKVIQSVFEENSKSLQENNRQTESNYIAQIARLSEDSKYKELRINELIREGLARERIDEEKAKEFMMISKQSEEKDDRIQELEEEVDALNQKQVKTEQQFQEKFRQLLDENQSERDEWIRSGTLTAEESSGLKAQIDDLYNENQRLHDELDKTNESYRIIEAEFTKHDQENNAMHHTIQVLEREVAQSNDILEQHEQENDTIVEEYQEKVKTLIDEKIENEQKYEDLETRYINVCEYLKEIHNSVKNEDYYSTDDEIEKTLDSAINFSEEEAEELYESVLNLYENKKQEMQSQCKDLELKLEEANIALQNKESELLDNQITGIQTLNNQEDQNMRKAMRALKEKLDDVSNELNSKNNIIQQLNDEIQDKIDKIAEIEVENEDYKEQLEQSQSKYYNILLSNLGNTTLVEELRTDISELVNERDNLHSELLKIKSQMNEVERAKNDEIFELINKISLLDREKEDEKSKVNNLNTEIVKIKQTNSSSNENMKNINHQLKLEYEQKIKVLESDKNEVINGKEMEICELNQKITQLESEKNEGLSGKEKEIDGLKQKVLLLESQIEDNKQKFNEMNDNHQKHIETTKTQISDLDDQIRQKDMQVNLISGKLSEIESLKQEITQKDLKIYELSGKVDKIPQLESEISKKDNEISDLTDKIASSSSNNSELVKSNNTKIASLEK